VGDGVGEGVAFLTAGVGADVAGDADCPRLIAAQSNQIIAIEAGVLRQNIIVKR
jgi:hypothetical protein